MGAESVTDRPVDVEIGLVIRARTRGAALARVQREILLEGADILQTLRRLEEIVQADMGVLPREWRAAMLQELQVLVNVLQKPAEPPAEHFGEIQLGDTVCLVANIKRSDRKEWRVVAVLGKAVLLRESNGWLVVGTASSNQVVSRPPLVKGQVVKHRGGQCAFRAIVVGTEMPSGSVHLRRFNGEYCFYHRADLIPLTPPTGGLT